jgi:hypothetical protein
VLRRGVCSLGCLLAAVILVVAVPLPPTRLAGQTWSVSSTPARGQRSMYYTSTAGFTIVVTGNATWADLRELAASLRPVAA